MPVQIQVDPRQIAAVQKMLKDIPVGGKSIIVPAVNDYIIGREQGETGEASHGLRHYPAYKYVSRAVAYGKTFVSDKQRRFVMASIREGRIDPGAPHRTGQYQRSWKTVGEAYRQKIVGQLPFDQFPARQNILGGWRRFSQIIVDNLAGAVRYAQSKFNEWLKAKGYKK
jgi:hypothetical protein